MEVVSDEIISRHNEDKVKRMKQIRNLIAFWILGLCNNYPYVIMLSAAFDLLHPDHHADQNADFIAEITENRTAKCTPISTGNCTIFAEIAENRTTKCNPISTGAILLADILPSLLIKLLIPFIGIETKIRVIIAVTLSILSFIITSLSHTTWMTFMGVICAALSSGLGEVTFLSYSSFFDKNVVSTWSSGTGGAGVIGALSYASLKIFFNTRVTLQIMIIMPMLTAFTFFFIIQHPFTKIPSQESFRCPETEPMLDDTEMSINDYIPTPRVHTFQQKINILKRLAKYMIPLGLVYFAEYFINQGLMELLYFPNASQWLDHKEQYRWYQVDYQIGVLISRSSVNLFQVQKLWLLPILQFTNVFVLCLHVILPFIPNIEIVLAIIFYEGLLGGCAYVNTFYKIISEEPEDDKEISMGITSLADSVGIAIAGIVSLPVHNALCKLLV